MILLLGDQAWIVLDAGRLVLALYFVASIAIGREYGN